MEQTCETWSRREMILEKLLYCASSAIVSAVATFSLTRFLQRRKRARKQVVTEKAWSSQRDDLIDAKDRQLLIAVARSKELERELAAIKEDKEAAEDACQDLEERLSEASNATKKAKHELGKAKFAQKEIEDSFSTLLSEKEAALDKIQGLKREKADAQKSENECRNSFTGLQRSLSTQLGDKKAAEKHVKKLDTELVELKASKSRLEAHYKTSLQKVEGKLRQAESEKYNAESDLNIQISQASNYRQKAQVLGGDFLKMQQEFQQCQMKLREAVLTLKEECQKHVKTSQNLAQASERIRELEKELRITRETARNQLKRSLSSLSSESSSSHQRSLK